MANKPANAPAHPNHITLGVPWQPYPTLTMPDPLVPAPGPLDSTNERETRRAHGYGYSDYT